MSVDPDRRWHRLVVRSRAKPERQGLKAESEGPNRARSVLTSEARKGAACYSSSSFQRNQLRAICALRTAKSKAKRPWLTSCRQAV